LFYTFACWLKEKGEIALPLFLIICSYEISKSIINSGEIGSGLQYKYTSLFLLNQAKLKIPF